MDEPFKHREDMEAWLNTQPREVISVFAARAALRTVPAFIVLLNDKRLKAKPEDIILLSLWATATALAAGRWPAKAVVINAAAADADVAARAAAKAAALATAADVAARAAARAAADVAADAAAYAASAAADAAAYAANAAAYAAVYGEFSRDRDFIEGGKSARELAVEPLWDVIPTYFSKSWADLKDYLLSLDQDWEVWTEWYEDRLRGNQGQPFTLPFVEEIEIGRDPENGHYGRVTFPPADYKNPAKINAQLKQLIEDYRARQALLEQDKTDTDFEDIAAATPLAEDIVLRKDGKFDVEFLPVRDLFEKNLARLNDAIEQTIKANAFHANSPEISFIRDIISKHSDDPQRIHDDCGFARSTITDLIKKDVIPDDFVVQRLLDALGQTEMDIRAYEPNVKETFEIRLSLKVETTAKVNKSEFEASAKGAQDIQSGRLATEIAEDVATVVAGEQGRAAYRLLSRFSRMYIKVQDAARNQTLTDAASVALTKAAPHLEAIVQALRVHFGL